MPCMNVFSSPIAPTRTYKKQESAVHEAKEKRASQIRVIHKVRLSRLERVYRHHGLRVE